MIKIQRSNLQSFCRTCLGQLHSADASSNFIISETPNLTKLLIICTTLNVNDDGDYIYPQSLCKKCYDMLQQFRDFRDMALQSAEVLRKILSDTSEDVNITTASNEQFMGDIYTIYPAAQNFKTEPEYKIEFEIAHLQENYLPESTNDIADPFMDSDISTPTISTARKRKLADDIDEKFKCKIGGCCFNPKSKKALEEHIKLEHATDFAMTPSYNNYEIFEVSYEEDLSAAINTQKAAIEYARENKTFCKAKQQLLKVKRPPKTPAERAREYRLRQKAKRAAEMEKYNGDERYLIYFKTPTTRRPNNQIANKTADTFRNTNTAVTFNSSYSDDLNQDVTMTNRKSQTKTETVNILNR